MFGKVIKYFHDKNYGFILGEDGNTYFIHGSNLCGEYIERGYHVFFKPFVTERSDYNAKYINVIEASSWKEKRGNKKRQY